MPRCRRASSPPSTRGLKIRVLPDDPADAGKYRVKDETLPEPPEGGSKPEGD
jgi:hypothetical protein